MAGTLDETSELKPRSDIHVRKFGHLTEASLQQPVLHDLLAFFSLLPLNSYKVYPGPLSEWNENKVSFESEVLNPM